MMNPAEFANIARCEADFWWFRGMRAILFALLDPVARHRRFGPVLEAGCGTGHFSKVLAERYGWTMFPLDLGWQGLEYAKGYGLSRMVQADVRSLPFADASFDALVSMDVIVHLPRGEEDQPMREFARVLRPGGLLALRVSALDILRSRHSQFAHERQRFTRGRVLDLAARHGFQAHRCTYANSLLMPVALAKFRLWEPLTRQPATSGVEPVAPWLDKLLGIPLTLESKWIGAGLSFPLGQSVVLIAENAA
jgi:SAM-dependent methyltransferase